MDTLLPILESFGLDAGRILSILGMTEMAKDYLNNSCGVPKFVKRFYPFLPFPAAALSCWTSPGEGENFLTCLLLYGLGSVFLHNFIKKTVQGK